MSSGCVLKHKVSKRDSAWAWVTLVASTLVLFSSFGFVYKFGIFYSYFLEEYNDTKEKTGMTLQTIMAGFYLKRQVTTLLMLRIMFRRLFVEIF